MYHALPYCQTSKPASSLTQAGVSHHVFSAILSFMACIAKRVYVYGTGGNLRLWASKEFREDIRAVRKGI